MSNLSGMSGMSGMSQRFMNRGKNSLIEGSHRSQTVDTVKGRIKMTIAAGERISKLT